MGTRKRSCVFLDTETTGLSFLDKIVEIAVLDEKGTPLVDTLVNPGVFITDDARRIHGITNAMVKDAPTLDAICDELISAVRGRCVVIYNAQFDLKFLPMKVKEAMGSVECCMHRFSEFNGEWNPHYQSYRWVTLDRALVLSGLTFEGHLHRAATDAEACRAIWNFLNQRKLKPRNLQTGKI
jgi:DNA polymerase III epsilon subunit-like protein